MEKANSIMGLKGYDLPSANIKSWRTIYENNQSRLDNIAISDDFSSMTYSELFDGWFNYAEVFTRLGITSRNKSRVLAVLPTIVAANLVDYGANITGAVVDFVDPTVSYSIFKEYVKSEKITDIAVLDLIYEKELKSKADELFDELGIRNIIIYHDKKMMEILPKPLRLYFNIKSLLPAKGRIVKMSQELKKCKESDIYIDDSASDELSLITHTSGTSTGVGKPIPLTDFNRNSLVLQHTLAGLEFEPGQSMMHFIPYFAAYGSVNTVHLGLYQGMKLIEIPLFSPEMFPELLLKYKPNIVLANAPAWENLVNNKKYENCDLSFLTIAISGGTPLQIESEIKINSFFRNHGASCLLSKGHGLSETCGCSSYTTEGYNHLGGMGVPMPLTEYLIRNPETGEIIEFKGEEIMGEALLASPNLTSGILDGKAVVKTEIINGKRYLPTKDIIRVNRDGSLEFVDRLDRMFPRYDAYNVYPSNIEKMLCSIPEIKNAVVVPYYDELRNGIMPKVYIEVASTIIASDLSEVISNIINNYFINNYKNNQYYHANFRDIPVVWVALNEMPRNTMGKEDYHRLKSGDITGVEYYVNMTQDNTGVKLHSVDVLECREQILRKKI